MDTLTKEVLSKDEDLAKIHNKIHKIEDWDLLHKNPMVTICMATYNHENYIREALDGVLMQKTGFEYEIIIKEDKSTDKTREIVEDYQKKHPDKIRLWLCKENLYSQKLKPQLDAFARGKYIARCEGDDYWIDPLKLQKQVVFLEENQDIKICCHPSYRLYGSECKKDGYGYWGEETKIISAKQAVINYITAPLQSILFRNENRTHDLSKITKELLGGHSTIQIFYAMPNGIAYLPEYMAVYRVRSLSSVSKILFKNDKGYLQRQMKNIKGLDLLNQYSNYQFNQEFLKSKRLRIFGFIKTGFLSTCQLTDLVFRYKLYKDFMPLLQALKTHVISKLARLKNKLKIRLK